MLNNKQIQLVQIAVRQAGLRSAGQDGRYYLLLAQYLQPNGTPVTSCKQLNNWQMDDLLAICESYGWCHRGKAADHYRALAAKRGKIASYGQQAAIECLSKDLGWNEFQLAGMIKRMTNQAVDNIAELSPKMAYRLIEALKAMVSRSTGIEYANLNEIKDDFSQGATDGQENKTCQVG